MTKDIYTFGSDRRLAFCKAYLSGRLRCEGSLFILPIPSFRSGTMAEGVEEGIAFMKEQLSFGDIILCYGANDTLRSLAAERGARLLDAASDEGYLEEGARLTAIGSIARLVLSEEKEPRHLRFGVIGYGRIGRQLAELLVFLGSSVTVLTTRRSLKEDLGRLGIRTVGVWELPLVREGKCDSPFGELDILINTAPSQILLPDDRSALSGVRVVELASGDNIPKEIPYERFDAVPAKSLPRSAGAAYGEVVIRELEKSGEM